MSKLKFSVGRGGGIISDNVRVAQDGRTDGRTETDTGANQYQRKRLITIQADAARNNELCSEWAKVYFSFHPSWQPYHVTTNVPKLNF